MGEPGMSAEQLERQRVWLNELEERFRARGVKPPSGYVPPVGDPAWDDNPNLCALMDGDEMHPTEETFALIGAALEERP